MYLILTKNLLLIFFSDYFGNLKERLQVPDEDAIAYYNTLRDKK